MIQKQIEKALAGDSKAFEVVMDRAYGKPVQYIAPMENQTHTGFTPDEIAILERTSRVLMGLEAQEIS